MRRLRDTSIALTVLSLILALPLEAAADFHIAAIDEMLASYGGDPSKQFIEIKMLAIGQRAVGNSIVALFGSDGVYVSDLYVVPSNLTAGGNGSRWTIATSAFQTATGFTADFTFPGGIPTAGGMICWGAPGLIPPPPASWDHSKLINSGSLAKQYVDCLAYGDYHGGPNPYLDAPSPRIPVGHSLHRVSMSAPPDDSVDFACGDPITPTNATGGTVSLAATTSCNCGNGSPDAGEQCDDGNEINGDCCSSTCQFETSSCDDGDLCTVNDTCSNGSCSGTPSGDPLCALDHFKCYKAAQAKAPRGDPPFPAFMPRRGLDVVVDQFGSRPLDLKKAISVCNPADKNDEDPTAPSDVSHLESYKAKVTRTVPPQPRFVKSIHQVQNQFGTIRLQLNAVDRLMVPSSKIVGTSGAPPYTATDLDHFECYKASVAKLPGNAFTPELGVKLVDELGGPHFYDLKKPTRLCAPANKNNEDPTAPSHVPHLVCYLAKLSKTTPPQPRFAKTAVSTNNQFGSEVLNALAVEELCVPSLKLD